MLIEVLGPGCRKCEALRAAAEAALSASGLAGRVEKVGDLEGMLRFGGVRALPALAVNGRVVACGRVPGAEELAGLLRAGASGGD